MINIHGKILEILTESEMWLLIHITKRLGKNMFCWPSNETLMKDTGWGVDKLRDVKNSLIEKKIIQVNIQAGRSNTYHVTTDLIGVYVPSNKLSESPSEKPTGYIEPPRKNQQPPPGENQYTTPSEKPTGKYCKSEVLVNEHNTLVKQVLEVIDELKLKYGNNRKHIQLIASNSRSSLVRARLKDFKKQWPDADFMKSIRFVFEYKAKEWTKTDMWKYFKPETLLSSEHFLDYCEQAKANNGTPVPSIKNSAQPPEYKLSLPKPSRLA